MLMQIPRPLLVKQLFTACLLAGLGCGGSGEEVVSVTGTVTHKNEPVAGIVVAFVPQAQTQTGVSTGQTDEDGKYTLTVASTGSSGAVVGAHKVWVSLPREPPAVDKEEKQRIAKERKGKPAEKGPLAAILKKYGQLEKTPLTVEVKGGEPIDIKLD
jgi:hypothetical protein